MLLAHGADEAGIRAEQTAVLPRILEAPEEPPSLAEMAARHGLQPASARPGLWSYIASLWRFRQFIGTYANGRVMASFGSSRLGRFWQVLSPLTNAAVYFTIFGVVLKLDRGMTNFVGYLCVGVFIFTFTQGVAQASVASISGQLGLVRALHFPRASLPIAHTFTQSQSLVGSMVVLFAIMLLTREPITLEWIYVVPSLGLLLMFSLGVAFIVGRLGAKYTDIKQLMPYIMRVWMYGSGVLYSVEIFADSLPAWLLPVVHANPLLVYIELVRYSLMETAPLASPVPQLWIMGGAWALVALVVGLVYFWRGEMEYGRD